MRRTIWIWPLIAASSLLAACGSAPPPSFGGSYASAPVHSPMGAPGPAEPAPPPPAPPDSSENEYVADGMSLKAEEVVIVSGTTGGGEMRRSVTKRDESANMPPAAAPPPPPPPPAPKPGKQSTTPQTSSTLEDSRGPAQPGAAEAVAVRAPMLIYTAGISMTVVEIKASLLSIEALTRELGGFLARRDNVSITIRVPVARFDEAVRRIEALGEVIHRNVSVEDVTEEFTDLEVRLQNLRAIRSRLEKLLEKAKGVEEAVLLERELGRVAGEIDRIEGRMKLLRDRASYSTITVSLRERQREAIGPRGPRLPVDWLNRLGLGRLLQL